MFSTRIEMFNNLRDHKNFKSASFTFVSGLFHELELTAIKLAAAALVQELTTNKNDAASADE